MRVTTALMLFALPLQAETLSREIARAGLGPTQARLMAEPNPDDADRFALGGVTSLRAIEGTFQERYAMGLTDRTGMLPPWWWCALTWPTRPGLPPMPIC